MDATTISVIIVTWNAQQYIADCLDSVVRQRGVNVEIIVVDNGSTDATRAILRPYAERITLIENSGNTGFCAANNQGILRAQGNYICTLNSDIILEPDYLRTLRAYCERHPGVGMVQGKFLRMDRQTIDCTGLLFSRRGKLYNRDEGCRDCASVPQDRDIFGPCAAAALYRRELLEQVRYEDEYFDARFFFLVEDFDLAWRARRCGWRARYIPDAVCVHCRNSSGHPSAFRQYLSFRNRYYLLIKNAGWKEIFWLVVFLGVYDLPRFVLVLMKNPYALQAMREITLYAPEMLRKRRCLRHRKRGVLCH